jgi:hypothetical protein
VTAPVITPSLTALGALLRAWTREGGTSAAELGTFTAETRPTADEAQNLLSVAATEVQALLGVPPDPDTAPGGRTWDDLLVQAASLLILYRAAVLVAASYLPEDAEDRFEAMYERLEPNAKILFEHFESGETTDQRAVLAVFSGADSYYDPLGVYQVGPGRAPGSRLAYTGTGGPYGYWIVDPQSGDQIYVPRPL